MFRLFTILFISLFFSCFAQANLALSDYRLFFDTKTRSNALLIRNTDNTPMQYQIELAHKDMTEQGTLIDVDDSQVEGRDAAKMLRYSPRRGLIKANDKQAIRFSVRKPANLPNGEYRAVLRIVAQNIRTDLQAGVNLNPKIAYNVPVIIRHGKLTAEAELLKPQLIMQNGRPTVSVYLASNSNRSLFGNFVITNEQGEEVGRLNNVAIYPPLTKRVVDIPLTKTVQGVASINFSENPQYGGDISLDKTINLN